MECQVCVEPYSKKRTKVHCSCGLDVCIVCAKRYILDRLELPHCMSCKNRWTKQFLYDNFKPSFVNGEYRRARKKILLDNELAKLPVTQEYVEVDKAFEYIDKNLTYWGWCDSMECIADYKLDNLSGNIVRRLIMIYRVLYSSVLQDEVIEMAFKDSRKSYKYYQSIKRYVDNYRRMWKEFKKGVRYRGRNRARHACGLNKISRKKFIHKCPGKDCKGFVSTAYKCGICNKFTCPKCLEIKEDTQDAKHTCDENNVKSAEIIKKDTKACPKCGTRIFKIHGCDQMWCTSCNTAFNWVTGAIYASNAQFHNPHYIAWVAKGSPGGNGGNNGNVNRAEVNAIINCGELPNFARVSRKYKRAYVPFYLKIHQHLLQPDIRASFRVKKNFMGDIYRFTSHIIDVTIQKLRDKTIIREEKNTGLRIRYMKDEITKEHLSKVARMRDNIIEKNVAMIQILEIFTDTMTNQFNNILQVDDADTVRAVDRLIDTAFKIRVYCNEQLANISQNYKMKVYQISDTFNVYDTEMMQMIKPEKKTIVI